MTREESSGAIEQLPLDEDELIGLHECIQKAETQGRECRNIDCSNNAAVIVSPPGHSMKKPICQECIPGHIQWYENLPARYEAEHVAEGSDDGS